MIALPNEIRAALLEFADAPSVRPNANRKRPTRPVETAPAGSFCGLAQTARIDDPITPPAQTRAAKVGVKAGHHAPESDSNHTDLPLGTGPAAGRPKRTRYVVA